MPIIRCLIRINQPTKHRLTFQQLDISDLGLAVCMKCLHHSEDATKMSFNAIFTDAIKLSCATVAFSHMTALSSQVNGFFLK